MYEESIKTSFVSIGFDMFTDGYFISCNTKGYENVYDIQLVNRKIDAVSQEKENTLDVLFTGDSEASNTFSPFQYWKEQGIASYNLGGSAQRLNDCYTVLEDVLKHQKPKVLVLRSQHFIPQECSL